jgi:hypothetical protein
MNKVMVFTHDPQCHLCAGSGECMIIYSDGSLASAICQCVELDFIPQHWLEKEATDTMYDRIM